MANWYVEIVEGATGEVVKRMGPFNERESDKVAGGAGRNLDWTRFTVREVEHFEAGADVYIANGPRSGEWGRVITLVNMKLALVAPHVPRSYREALYLNLCDLERLP